MLINSLRFGPLEICQNEVIWMARPLLGFEKLTRFCLIEREEFLPFSWLQSVDDPATVFIVVNPAIFNDHYRIEINPNEVAEIDPTSPELIETYVIASVPEDWRRMTVNMQAPLLINTVNNKAKQLVLMNSEYKVQQNVFENEALTTPASKSKVKEAVGV